MKCQDQLLSACRQRRDLLGYEHLRLVRRRLQSVELDSQLTGSVPTAR